MNTNQPLHGGAHQSDGRVEFLNECEQVITTDEMPNKYVVNAAQYPVFVIDDDPAEVELRKILPSFIENERKASTKLDSERKVHSSPVKFRRKLSQDTLSTLQPDQLDAFKRRSSLFITNTDKVISGNADDSTAAIGRSQLYKNIDSEPINIVDYGDNNAVDGDDNRTDNGSHLIFGSPQVAILKPVSTYPIDIVHVEAAKNKETLSAPNINWIDVQARQQDDLLGSESFTPKFKSVEDIPGTPMDSTLANNQASYQSSQSNLLAESQRKFSDDFTLDKPSTTPPTEDNSTDTTVNESDTFEDNSDHIETNVTGGNYVKNGGPHRNRSESQKHRRLMWDRHSNSLQIENDELDAESLMFRDGRRKIDMIMCYEEEYQGVMTENEARKREQRRIFQDNLIKEGLELEIEDKAMSYDEKTFFVKIHLPWRTESRYAEVMNMKLPVKRFITISVKAWANESKALRSPNFLRRWWEALNRMLEYDERLIPREPSYYSATAGANPQEQFIVKDRCTSYNSAQRSMIVMQILLRTKYDETEKSGIRRLLNNKTYLACFPLHEGRYDVESAAKTYDRRLLYLEWARPSKWYKKQPLCLVRKYFGDKIAMYFCWLGFYTKMLVVPAIVGTLCFIYGLLTFDSKDNVPTKEICDENGVGNRTLCPLCDKACRYQQLSESCLFAKITYLFDNPSTVFFAIFMSFWATTFLELWKRKQSVLKWEWDLQNNDVDEEPRPEFEANVKTFRINPVTREKEPYMSTWARGIRFFASASCVLFMISIVVCAVLGTIIYRISLVSVVYGGGNFFVKEHAKLVTTMTAALINLVIIMCLTRVYHRIAIELTNMENPRTQTEYEESYTFKIFFFEFMNFYSSLIYIAFFKGRFFDYPGDALSRQNEFLKLKGDICDPVGCLSELCIQLAIIMIGKQVWNNFMEYLGPTIYNWWRKRKHAKETKDEDHLHMSWEQDYHLQDPGRLALFDEYLEMIIQYGFVSLFVAAFPLAPLFAFLNNIAEIRLDAYKMVSQSRRPLAERVEDIGAWYGILRIITYLAVVSNAFVIAYTSDFIPRMVYKYVYSKKHNLEGYIEYTLSVFNTSEYKAEWGTKTQSDPDTCEYRGYRNGPGEVDPYGLNAQYWHVFAARLAFVVIFEHVVFILTSIMQFIIPDIPVEIKTQMQREQLLAKEAKYQHGLKKARENDYEELLHAIREQNNNSRQGHVPGARTSWARRLSRISDGLDAHIEIPNKPRRSIESTVWQVT